LLTEAVVAIKDRLKRLRTAAGLTQQALAFKAGLSMSAVIHIEKGRIPDPRISTLRRLAGALGVTVDELAGPEDEPEPPARPDKPGRPRKRKGGGQ
jgi:transcriptional regulator with XRE-family HTH domain